jgi:LysR family transcriptional regulator (chromosome initiation inhibitor)
MEQLATLLALVTSGSFDLAAAALHVTPSAISQRVKALEHTCGQILVQRTTPIRLTHAGDIVLRYARQVQLLEADTVRALTAQHSEGDTFRVSLAVNADSLATWFLDALAGLGERLDIAFDLHREDQEHTTALLRSGTVMAAVTSTAKAVQGCRSEPLGQMRYRAVATPAFVHRWLSDGSGLLALPQAPVVAFERHDELQERFLHTHTGAGSSGPIHYIPTSNDFARAILLGFGWGLLPEQQSSTELSDGHLIDLAPYDTVDVPLYWQRWNLTSPLLDAITTAVRAEANRTLYPHYSIRTGDCSGS